MIFSSQISNKYIYIYIYIYLLIQREKSKYPKMNKVHKWYQICYLDFYYYHSLWVFPTSVSWWSFTGVSKSPHVYRNLLNILTDLNNAVVWMISKRPLISSSSSPLTKPLHTNYNWCHRPFYVLLPFSTLARSLFSLSLSLTLRSDGAAKAKIVNYH